jgi:hypothetical protein
LPNELEDLIFSLVFEAGSDIVKKLQRVDWDELINSGNSLDDLCESFLNVILQAAGESIPNKIITVRKTDPPWMNGAYVNSFVPEFSEVCPRNWKI